MATGLVFRLLGAMEVLVDGCPVELGRQRERGLLAVLLLRAGRVVPVDRLVDLLWDDCPTANARKNLYSNVSRLRGQIAGADTWLVSRDGGYVADVDPLTVDAHQFRALVDVGRRESDPRKQARILEQALALWRGPVLADLASARLRDRIAGDLAELRLVATELAFDAGLAAGRHSDLIGSLSVLTAEHPLRERFVGQLMLALYRSGRNAEAVAVYQRLRIRLADELGIDPGTELQERYLSIVRQDSALLADSPTHVGLVPSQLPLATSYFTGRTTTLAELDGATVITIRGMAGVGKTALAVYWAHQVADRFQDGQLFVDLGGYSVGVPRSASEVLGHFLTALGVPAERLPSDGAERASLYRTLLAGKKILVLLDNAASAEQVRPLIPGTAGCVTVITSRDDLAGLVATHDASPITLDVLTEADAVQLLVDLLGQAEVQELARLCGFLPLALRIAAAQILTHGISVRELVSGLRHGGRLDVLGIPGDPRIAVRAALDLSDRTLEPAARRLFRLLTLSPGRDFTVPVAATLLDVPIDEGAAVLRVLVGAHLVQAGPDDRFRMHDLVREYAGERTVQEVSKEDASAAVTRVVGWYLHTACNADLALTPFRARPGAGSAPPVTCPPLQFARHADALAWCVAEEANLVAAVRQAADYDLHAMAWRIPASLGYFSWIHKGQSDLVECFRVGRVSAQLNDDTEGLAWMAFGMGIVLEQRRRFDESIVEYQAAVTRYQDIGLLWAAGCALTNIGNSYRDLGRFADAFEYYRRSVQVFEDCGMRWGVGLNLYGEGNAYRLMGRLDEALTSYQASAAISAELGFHWGVGVNLMYAGDTHRLLGQPEVAIDHYERALTAARDSGDQKGQGEVLDLIAQTARDLGRFAEAAENWEHALAIFERLDHPRASEIRASLATLRGSG